jgi:hypothetical protein
VRPLHIGLVLWVYTEGYRFCCAVAMPFSTGLALCIFRCRSLHFHYAENTSGTKGFTPFSRAVSSG